MSEWLSAEERGKKRKSDQKHQQQQQQQQKQPKKQQFNLEEFSNLRKSIWLAHQQRMSLFLKQNAAETSSNSSTSSTSWNCEATTNTTYSDKSNTEKEEVNEEVLFGSIGDSLMVPSHENISSDDDSLNLSDQNNHLNDLNDLNDL